MNQPRSRIVIYSKDVANITGTRPDTARKLLSRIRRSLNKKQGAHITVFEFCEYMNFRMEWVAPFLQK